MSNRPVDINLSKTNIPSWDPDSPNYDVNAHSAHIARIMSRGIVADRTHVDLPGGYHGEWVNTDPIEVERMKALGFWVDKEFAQSRGIHDAGDGTVRVGDVLFMVCHRRTKQIIDAINQKKYREANDPKKTKEEIRYRAELRKQRDLTGVDIPEVDTSSLDGVYGSEIDSQLRAGSLESSPIGERLDKPQSSPTQIVFKG